MTIKEFYNKFLEIRKISTDSRKVIPNSIFFALKGDNFNGNQYAREALELGCVLAVVDEDNFPKDDRIVYVPDVLLFLQELAHYHRSQFKTPLLAITGTNGKTTTKELITAVLKKKYRVVATRGNLNNHIGVPLTLLEMDEETQIAVVEMGANHTGEISRLCKIADPTHGLITNIGRAHLEGFGSPANVREAKNELYIYIRENEGAVFINEDDLVLTGLAHNLQKSGYGKHDKAAIQGKDPHEIFSAVQWKSPPEIDGWMMVQTRLVGGYNFYNILAAISVGKYFGLAPERINQALESYVPGMNRSQYLETSRNRVILDAYNANPDSMSAAITNFRQYRADRKVAILGDMFELGNYSYEAHKEVLQALTESSFCKVYLVGPEFARVAVNEDATVFIRLDSLIAFLDEVPLNQSLILLKGSQGMGMEKLLSYL